MASANFMNQPLDPLTPSAASSVRTKSFCVWFAAFPLLAGLCAVGVNLLPLWFAYLLPYAVGIASLLILIAAMATGAATKTLGASMAGLFGGLPLLLFIYVVVGAVGQATWKASYEEFQKFSQVVARGDRKATTSALDDLRNFTPAEALCILGSDNGDGGWGYLMPRNPVAQHNDMGRGYFISTQRLFDAAEIVVSIQPAKRETQVALHKMLGDLYSRGDQATFPRWEQLWSRTKTATGGPAGWQFDGTRLRQSLDTCGGDDDAQLAELVTQINKPPAKPEDAPVPHAELQQAVDDALRDAQANAAVR